MRLANMDDDKLIFLIQENEEIFNKINPNFKFPDRNRAVWLKIAKEMGTTGIYGECIYIHMWYNL